LSSKSAPRGNRDWTSTTLQKIYTLNSLEGSFTGLQMVSYLYVGFKRIDPHLDVGIDLSEEYKMALDLIKKEEVSWLYI